MNIIKIIIGILLILEIFVACKVKESKSASTELTEKFYSIYREEKDPERYYKAEDYMRSLDAKSRLQVARELIKDPYGPITYYGANILIKEGYEDEAVPALADIITSGRYKTKDEKGIEHDWGFGRNWVEHEDETFMMRMVFKIFRYFIANWERYTEQERARAYGMMSGWLQLDPEKPLSAEAAEEAMKRLEKRQSILMQFKESIKKNKIPQSKLMDKFYSIYHEEKDPGIRYTKISIYLGSLDAESRLQVAREMSKASDAEISCSGASILIIEGYDRYADEAVAAFADLVTSGRAEIKDYLDRSCDYWVRHHAGTQLRFKIKICRYFIANWGRYTEQERARAYAIMTSLLEIDPNKPISVDAIEKAIKKFESMPSE